MSWIAGVFSAPDGTMFSIHSEHVRSESRVYWPVQWTGGRWVRVLDVCDDKTDRRLVSRAIERYANKHHQR